MKQSKVRKSTSLSIFKTLPMQDIIFNPKQFHVGQSKITLLPQRIITRRNSQPTLPRTQKPSINNKQPRSPKQTQLSILKKINQNLMKQNVELKKQLELYKKISRNNSSKKKKNSYMDQFSRRDMMMANKKSIAVVQKINVTKCSSRLADSQTGLCSSKQMSCNIDFPQSINDMYDNFIRKAIKPNFNQFNQQLKKFFFDIEEAYIKLKYLFESVNRQERAGSNSEFGKCQGLMESIGDICQLKIQKEKAGKYPGLVEKPRSRGKVEKALGKDKAQQKEDILELMSPQEVVYRFEKYIQKILRSRPTLRSLKQSLAVRQLTRKLSEV